MAQRTHETPPGLQYDNVAPIEYFTELVAGFEHDMQIFRQEIENTEKHIQSLSQPMALTPQGKQHHHLLFYVLLTLYTALNETVIYADVPRIARKCTHNFRYIMLLNGK